MAELGHGTILVPRPPRRSAEQWPALSRRSDGGVSVQSRTPSTQRRVCMWCIFSLMARWMRLIPWAMLGPENFEALREARGKGKDGLLLPEKMAETYYHLAQQHRSGGPTS